MTRPTKPPVPFMRAEHLRADLAAWKDAERLQVISRAKFLGLLRSLVSEYGSSSVGRALGWSRQRVHDMLKDSKGGS